MTKQYIITEDTITRFKIEQKRAQKARDHAVCKCFPFLEAYWEGKLEQINYVLDMITIDNEQEAEGETST